MPTPLPIGRQRGSILLYSLVALLLMFLGALFALRGSLNDTALTDHYSQRQKNVQASDLALQYIVKNYGNSLSLNSASGQSWYYAALPAQMVDAANAASYWRSCIATASGGSSSGSGWSGSTTPTCAKLPTLAGKQTAWFFVQPTGVSNGAAMYYDIWIHTSDPRSEVWVDTEAIYLD